MGAGPLGLVIRSIPESPALRGGRTHPGVGQGYICHGKHGLVHHRGIRRSRARHSLWTRMQAAGVRDERPLRRMVAAAFGDFARKVRAWHLPDDGQAVCRTIPVRVCASPFFPHGKRSGATGLIVSAASAMAARLPGPGATTVSMSVHSPRTRLSRTVSPRFWSAGKSASRSAMTSRATIILLIPSIRPHVEPDAPRTRIVLGRSCAKIVAGKMQSRPQSRPMAAKRRIGLFLSLHGRMQASTGRMHDPPFRWRHRP